MSLLKESEPGDEGPVTVSISRRIKPGREADYEAWVHGIIAAASPFPGHQGVNILRPSKQTDGQYVLIYRYDTWAHCDNWEQSDIRAEWIARLDDMVEGEAQTKRVTGLEFWFDMPEIPAAKTPSKHKMALTLIVVVFVLVYLAQLTLGPLLANWPLVARVLLISALQVLLLTYLIMPRITRLLKNWLYS
jgi:antibiotic biosynthesis monooxygenase (ABM) superfamily enzyme